jgi:O-antigen/teichoic acid export membrane protein
MILRFISTIRLAVGQMFGDRDYAGALASGYVQIAVNAVVQLAMVPLYLETIGRAGFGILMVLLALATYLAVGALWLTGGTTRTLGEMAANDDRVGFAEVWSAGRTAALVYTGAVGAFALAILALFPGLLGSDALGVAGLWPALVLFALNVVASWVLAIDRVGLNVTRHQTWSNVLGIGAQLVFVALAVPMLLGDGGSLANVTGALLVGNLVALVAAGVLWRRLGYRLSWWQNLRAQRRRVAGMLTRRGRDFTLYGVLSLTLQADILIISFIGGPLLAADFALVWKIAEVVVVALGRFPDALQPRIIQHDVRGEHDELAISIRRIDHLMIVAAATFGVIYAFAGPAVVEMWVGADNAPHGPLALYGYMLAGGAAFWLAITKLPIAAAFVTLRLRPMVAIMSVELTAKIALIAALVGTVGFLAPLAAINITHVLGAAWAYRWLLRKVTKAE